MASGMRLGLWMRYLAGQRLAPFVPTPPHVAKRMLELAEVGPEDHVVDLGCGDGRLLITAAKQFGASGYGVELDRGLYEEAKRGIEEEGVGDMVSIEHKDAMSVDLSNATVLTLFLSESGNDKLLPKIKQQLGFEGRVVSFCWPFSSLEPYAIIKVDGISLYLYRPQQQMQA